MERQQSLVLVLGATGRLGRAVVVAFAREGWRVRAQLRGVQRWQEREWPEGVEPCYCNGYQRDELAAAAEGAAVIVNALNPPYDQWQEKALPLAESALSAARASRALLIFPGNIYNYGSELPEVLHEDTPQVANTSKAAIRIEMESRLHAAAGEGVNCVVLRSGDYFGEEARGSWFDKVITQELAKGVVVYPGPRDRQHAWSYLPDLATAMVRIAAQAERLQGFHSYHFPGYTLTGAQLHQALEVATARPLKLRPLPWWQLRLTAPFSPMARALLEMRYLWQRSHRLQDGPLSQLIGPLPTTPFHIALRSTLNGLRLTSGENGDA